VLGNQRQCVASTNTNILAHREGIEADMIKDNIVYKAVKDRLELTILSLPLFLLAENEGFR